MAQPFRSVRRDGKQKGHLEGNAPPCSVVESLNGANTQRRFKTPSVTFNPEREAMKVPQGRLRIQVGVCGLVYTHQFVSFAFQALQQQCGLREDGWDAGKGQRKVGRCKVALLVKKK